MKKIVFLFVILAMLGIAKAELFVNGDFETGAWGGGGSGSGQGYGWQNMAPIFQADGQGSDGGNWMQLDTSGIAPAATWGWGWSGIWYATEPPVTSGTVLKLSGMAKNVNVTRGNTLRAFIRYTDIDGYYVDLNGDGSYDKNDDRYTPTWLTGASWAAFSDTFTVPAVDALGNPFFAPIATISVTFSVETLPGDVVGVDELSLISSEVSDPDVAQTEPGVSDDIDAVFHWNAIPDLLGPNEVLPSLQRQDVYLSGDLNAGGDPNLRYIGSDTTVVLTDRASQFPESGTYGLDYDGSYEWCVVSIKTGGTTPAPSVGNPLSNVTNANDLIGPIWPLAALAADYEPVVEITNSGIITWNDMLPQNLIATVDDNGEGDIGSVVWTVTESPETYPGADPNVAVTDTTSDVLNPTATFNVNTADPNTNGYYTVVLTVTESVDGTPIVKSGTSDVWIAAMEDSCAAAKEVWDWETARANDLDVDANCVVDLADFAAFGSDWMDDISLTEPFVYLP